MNINFTVSPKITFESDGFYYADITINSISISQTHFHVTHICAVSLTEYDELFGNNNYPNEINSEACTTEMEHITDKQYQIDFTWSVSDSTSLYTNTNQTLLVSLQIHNHLLFSLASQNYVKTLGITAALSSVANYTEENVTSYILSQTVLHNIDTTHQYITFNNISMNSFLPSSFCGVFSLICLQLQITSNGSITTCKNLTAKDQYCKPAFFSISLGKLFLSERYDEPQYNSHIITFFFHLFITNNNSYPLTINDLENSVLQLHLHSNHIKNATYCISHKILRVLPNPSADDLAMSNHSIIRHSTDVSPFIVSGNISVSKECLKNLSVFQNSDFKQLKQLYYLNITANLPQISHKIDISHGKTHSVIKGFHFNEMPLEVDSVKLIRFSELRMGTTEIWKMSILLKVAFESSLGSNKFDFARALSIKVIIADDSVLDNYDNANSMQYNVTVHTFQDDDDLNSKSGYKRMHYVVSGHFFIDIDEAKILSPNLKCTAQKFIVKCDLESNKLPHITVGELKPVFKIVSLSKHNCITKKLSYSRMKEMNTIQLDIKVLDLSYPSIISTAESHYGVALSVEMSSEDIDERSRFLLNAIKQPVTLTFTSALEIHKFSKTHMKAFTPIAQFNISVGLDELMKPTYRRVARKQNYLFTSNALDRDVCGWSQVRLTPWNVKASSVLVNFQVLKSVSSNCHIFVQCRSDYVSVNNFIQIEPLPFHKTISFSENSFAFKASFVLTFHKSIIFNNSLTFSAKVNSSLESLGIVSSLTNVSYTIRPFPISYSTFSQPIHSYHLILHGNIEVNYTEHYQISGIAINHIELFVEWQSFLTHVGVLKFHISEVSALDQRYRFSIKHFSFLSGKKMHHNSAG